MRAGGVGGRDAGLGDGSAGTGGRGAGLGGRTLLATVLAGLLLTGCDDQLKYVPWFSFMTTQPSLEAYEEAPVPPPEGTMPVDGERAWTLAEADTALTNPLGESVEDASRGQLLYTRFCTPCHGESGRGDGPVMTPQRPNGIPYTPAMDLLSGAARERSDGYIFGIIAEGRGLMPSYRRIPPADRWHLVTYVRRLQEAGGGEAAGEEAGGVAAGAGEAAASATGGGG